MGRGVGAEGQPEGGGGVAQAVQHDAGLHPRQARLGIDLQHAVEVPGRSSTTATLQHWPARSPPARLDGDARRPAGIERH
jgi:hypothetical protein